ncbi:MAG: DEAD/DEAH box helicase [Erysipelotrichaceae bacterium]
MASEFVPHIYQQTSIDWVMDHPKSGLFLPMGMGKTSVTLTAIHDLIYDYFKISKVLIVAPIRVADSTWPSEIHKWRHTQDLTFSKVLGTSKQRVQALMQEADIYLINRENVVWLVDYYRSDWPFDMVVVDELSSFKNPSSKRFKALKKVMPLVDRFIGLTGTPTPKGLPDLWSQLYLMDAGERLGKTLTIFRNRYLVPGRRNGMIVYDWLLQPNAERRIYDDISDICMSLKVEDWLEVPECQYLNYEIELPIKVKYQYKRFKNEKIIELSDNGVITGANAGVVTNKLLQFTAGAVYDENYEIIQIHDCKLDALEDLVEAANGQPVIVYYYFKFDYGRILKRFANLNVRTIKTPQDVEDWNAGKIDLLLVHPASVGHGLNLQDGGSIIIWYTLPNWNLELYQQANARLNRQGQKESVRIYHIIAKDTIDEDMLKSLDKKDVSQNALMEALKISHVPLPSSIGKTVHDKKSLKEITL